MANDAVQSDRNNHTSGIAERQRTYFRTGATRDLGFRKQKLIILKAAIRAREQSIIEALKQDLGRAAIESFTSEIGVLYHEIDVALKHLRTWARPERVKTPLVLFPAKSWIRREPYGAALIIAPWNYPFHLALAPLIAAIAAGNCAVIKPSEAAPKTAAVIAELIGACFDPAYVVAMQGGVAETSQLLEQRFDTIFFTGGGHVGRIVYAAAAKNLTPVTLELGGKNPCIVTADADLDVAARRIAWGKFVNAGQTCIAPDFVLVHASVRQALVIRLKAAIAKFYGRDPKESPDYGRIINDHHFQRLSVLLGDGEIIAGGQTETATRYIAPTLIGAVGFDSPIMRDEIFGPILPIIPYDDLERTFEALETLPKPLALYLFSADRAAKDNVLQRLSAGGIAINDTFAQLLNFNLPFGGVGDSGTGAYHGKTGFDTFSHAKSIVERSTWLDPRLKYPPYRMPLFMMRLLMRFLL
ncbi:MAG: aldehyde dehydrogenase [Allorhizobium sp.]